MSALQVIEKTSCWSVRELAQALSRDPRHYQIAALSLLLTYGIIQLHFDVRLVQVFLILAAALGTQWVFTRLLNCGRFDPRSALISGFSLCLLCRTDLWALAALTAVVAVSSKFLLCWNGKHLFNPTNLGLVFMMLCTKGCVWVSPGQWGDVGFFAFLVVCAGGLVVMRASRADVTLAFLAFYLALVFGRSLWLGEPMAIPLHRLQNGALLIFAFFMISDPKTTPNSRAGRIIFAMLVALGAAYVQFRLFRTNGLLWSLALFALAVPILDKILPGRLFNWSTTTPPPIHDLESNTNARSNTMKGNTYEPILA